MSAALLGRWRLALSLLLALALGTAAAFVALNARAHRLDLAAADREEAWDDLQGGAVRLGSLAADTFTPARTAGLGLDPASVQRLHQEAEERSRNLLAALRDDARLAGGEPLAPAVEGLSAAWRRFSAALASLAGGHPQPAETRQAVGELDRAYGALAARLQGFQIDAAVLRRQSHEERDAALRRLSVLSLGLALLALLLAAGFALLVFGLGRSWDESNKKSEEITDQLRAAQEQADRSDFDSRELFTTSNDLLFAVDPEGRFRVANPRWRAALGVQPEEVRSLRLQDLLRPDCRGVWDQLIAAARHQDRVPRFEAVLVARDGRDVMVEGACWPRYEGEELVELRGVMLDVTRQRRAEEEVVQGEERYRELFQNSQGIICTHDLEGRILALNPAGASQLGYAPEELLGRNLLDVLVPEVRSLFPRYLAEIRRTRLESGLMRLQNRAGEEQVWMYRNVLVEKPGALPFVLAYAIDVTERKRIEEELERSERKYRALFENSRDLIQSVSADGRFEYVNPHWLKTLGYGEEELRGLHFTDTLLPSEVEHCREIFADLENGKDQPEVETVFLAKDGRKVFVEGSISSSFRDGRFVATRGFFHDVTQRRLLEAERQLYLDRIQRQNLDLELRNREVERANRLKSEFLATMSHELRTPLTAIIGFSDLLDEDEETPLDPKHKTYLGYVRKGARHLLQLINDVLDLSKIEAGRLEIAPEDLSLPDVVAEVLATIEPLAAGKRIALVSEIPGDGRVFADHVRLRQIFFNLLSNAVKFTPEGGRVALSASTLGSLTCISVSDTGMGIPDEQQEAIFSEFHQVGTSAKGLKEGTGLGLAIVRRLVELHRGRIWVESLAGKGSVFTFLLPADRAAMETSRALFEPVAGVPHERPVRERPLVLVIDDDPASRELLVSYLRGDGCDAATAANGTEAAAKVRGLRPNLVTLDLAIDGEQGWRILEEVKRLPADLRPPVLVVSVIDEKRKGFALGADDYLVKPVERARLISHVRRFVRPPEPRSRSVLVLDDGLSDSWSDGADQEPGSPSGLFAAVLAAGFQPILAREGREALRILLEARPGALVVNLLMSDHDGFQTILRLRSHPDLHGLPVVALATDDLSLHNMDLLTLGPTRVLFRGETLWREHLARELTRILGAARPETAAGAPEAGGAAPEARPG